MQVKGRIKNRSHGLALVACFAVLLLSGPGWADDAGAAAPQLNTGGWEPYFAVGFDVMVQSVRASFESDTIPVLERPPPPNPNPGPDEDPNEPYCCAPNGTASVADFGSGTVSPPMVGFELGLWTPVLAENAWRPRLFVRARGAFPTTAGRNIERTNTTTVQVSKGIEYSASYLVGGGIDLRLPTEDQRLKVRLSVDYFRTEFEPRVDVLITEQIDPLGSPFFTKPVFQGVGAGSAAVQGIAPGLALEAFLGRRGSLGFSLYTEALFMVLLGERSSEVEVTNQIGAGSGTYRLEMDSFSYGIGAGFRVVWMGAEG